MIYFIHESNLTKGPFDLTELRQANLSPDVFIWREGFEKWIPLYVLPEWNGPEFIYQTSVSKKNFANLFGSLPADWRAVAWATLMMGSLHFLHDAIPFNKMVYNLFRLGPLLLYYWGLYQIGRTFNLKGLRQSTRWLALNDVLFMTGWLGNWAETSLGAISILAGIRLILDLWTLRTIFIPQLITVVVVTQAFDEVNIIMGIVPFYVSSLNYLISLVSIVLLYHELADYAAKDVTPPAWNSHITV